ncbi:hypothetical protein [Achromobacter sp. GbtcB20]|uniref:hypothetical protein n=1 Tax=Achromobacter sp. GbtcB20 TaxID=2824765 RepID=UPI001266D0B0|nr:hypothetical protein [Achromobacter sp. GbtcB20]
MKRAAWTKTALNVGLPYTDIPAYVVSPLVLAWATPDAVASYVAWPLGLAGCGWLLYLNRVKKRTPGWAMRRLRSWMRGAVYHARPIWHVRRMSRPTSPEIALGIAVAKLDDEMTAFGFEPATSNAPRPAEAQTKKPSKANKRTDQSKRKNSQ